MPTLKEFQDMSKEESKKVQEAAKADPSNLLLSLTAAGDQVKRQLLDATDSPEAIGKIVDMVTPTGLGTIAGVGSKTWNAADAALPEKLWKMGKSAKDIWQEAKTYIGPIDQKLRQEISDIGAKLKTFKGEKGNPVKLGDMLDHEELYKAYPQLRNLDVVPAGKFAFGNIENGTPVMMVNAKTLRDAPDKFLSSVLHEVQHNVQSIERFTKGGSSEAAKGTKTFSRMVEDLPPDIQEWEGGASLINRLASRVYRRMGGEAESRAVQARQHLNPADARNILPTDSYDVPLSQLIEGIK